MVEKVFTLTQNAHYLDVARLLLHNTKGMMALPRSLYDLLVPGWIQEPCTYAGLWHTPWLVAMGFNQPVKRYCGIGRSTTTIMQRAV